MNNLIDRIMKYKYYIKDRYLERGEKIKEREREMEGQKNDYYVSDFWVTLDFELPMH